NIRCQLPAGACSHKTAHKHKCFLERETLINLSVSYVPFCGELSGVSFRLAHVVTKRLINTNVFVSARPSLIFLCLMCLFVANYPVLRRPAAIPLIVAASA